MQYKSDKFLLAFALASERSYFGLAAQNQLGKNYVFSIVPGLESLPAAAVCILDTDRAETSAVADAVAAGEEAFARSGAHIARFYTGRTATQFHALMEGKGYQCRTEIIHAFAPLSGNQNEPEDTNLCRVISEDDWARKSAIQAPSFMAADGHASDPKQWLSLERKKAETGEIDFWIYSHSGQPVVTVGLMRCAEGVMRIKNFHVHADHRGVGLGKAALRALLAMLKNAGEDAVVLLSVDGSVGGHLYRSAGARDIGRIHEWSREL